MGKPDHVTLRAALSGDPPRAAVALLGARVVCDSDDGQVVIRIAEAEAYGGEGEDPGSHAHRGRTARNASMWAPAGTAYVYFTYGMHWCLNVVTGAEGTAGAVLLRAGEVVDGVDLARTRRRTNRDRDLARGPARLTQALGIDRGFDGVDLFDLTSRLRLEPSATPIDLSRIRTGPRVGVSGAGADTPWRFWLDGDAMVSPYRRARG